MPFEKESSVIPLGVAFEYGSINGGERSMLLVLDRLIGNGISPVAICPAESPLEMELKSRKIPCFNWPENSLQTGSDAQRERLTSWLQHVIAQTGIQILHANSLTMARKLGTISDQLACTVTGHVRDIMNIAPNAVKSLQKLQLVAVSDATRKNLIKQGIASDRVVRIYNGIDASRFQPRSRTGRLLIELGLSETTKLAATVGQICLRKGQNDLAEAAVLLKDKLPDLHFVIIGERHSTKQESIDFEANIEQTFQQVGIRHRLHRLPFRDDIHELLNEVDILVHPARQEPLGRVLLEAAFSGVSVVATNVGGTQEIFTNGDNAVLVPPGNPELLSSGILNLLQDPDRAATLGRNARTAVLEKFSDDAAARNLLQFWRQQLVDL
ncbi:glycosyltransferase family 4 protein [Planctomicrobium sp. SH668]|uniref:glycosyltransferase family 4 protein n=1 Tax=Planctomicrobium sp. SH668 TaxID=3448126 RepID=UPI003F5BBB4D